MAPPSMVPSLVRTLYFTAIRDSPYLVAMPEYACEPAPEHRARSSKGNGCSHAYDISCADGGGQSSGQSRKLADITVGIRVPGDGQTDACEGPALDKLSGR